MNDLRHRLLTALATGSVEELAVALGLLLQPKTHEAGPDLNDRTGLASTDEIAKSSRT
jgi:hypothetical protein